MAQRGIVWTTLIGQVDADTLCGRGNLCRSRYPLAGTMPTGGGNPEWNMTAVIGPNAMEDPV